MLALKWANNTSRSRSRSAAWAPTFMITLLICTALTQQALARHRRIKTAANEKVCERKMTPITLNVEGCKPRITHVPTCTGVGYSYARWKPTAPFIEEDCLCCASTSHRVTRRRLTLVCGGQNVNHTFFFQKISKCGHVACYPRNG